MSTFVVAGGHTLEGTTTVPGDKSISHRALLVAAAAQGRSTLRGLPQGADVASTASCLRGFGVAVHGDDDAVVVDGSGVRAWREPESPLDCGNSGTTMRILSGLAARCGFRTVLDGDASLRSRPMERVADPLRRMGARVSTSDGRPPMTIEGGTLSGVTVTLEVASAQVKSAVLLAGLGATGTTEVIEPHPSRDHTERILLALDAPLTAGKGERGAVRVSVEPFEPAGFSVDVPGDPSSAASIVAAGVLTGFVRVADVCLNPTRIAFFDALARMGARVRWETTEDRLGEPVGWVEADRSTLGGIGIEGPIYAAIQDELPLLAVVATQAEGTTTVTGAAELRLKETDRIAAICDGLTRLGADLTEHDDGFEIRGPTPLNGTTVDARGDHRIAMALAVAGLVAEGTTRVDGAESAAVSWPEFADALEGLGAHIEVEP